MTIPQGVGFGAATIGNLYRAVSDDTARTTVEAAWAAGVRYFDTAPHYGLGLSERRLGAALADLPRSQYLISTKVGRWLEPTTGGGSDLAIGGYDVAATHRRVWDFSADGVKRSLEASLERLGLDRVDIVYLHDPDDHWREALDDAYPALAALREEGVVDRIGVGMNQWEIPARFVRETDIDLIMLASRYTLLEQPALHELLPLCARRGVSVVAAAVFNTGILSRPEVGDDARYNFTRATAEKIATARQLAQVCARHGVSLPQAAIQFPLAHPVVSAVVVGARTATQMTDAATWMTTPLPTDLWDDLRAERLLPPDTPVPQTR
jgi:D-threo-aldose 1-dehydrogenase